MLDLLRDGARIGLGAYTLGLSEIGGHGGLAGKLGLSSPGDGGRHARGTLNDLGIDSASRTYYADTMAAMTRANWGRQKGRLRPLMDRMTYAYWNPDAHREAQQEASRLAVSGVNQARDDFGRQARSIGLDLAPDQQAEVQRQFDTAANVARLDAMNRATRATDDRKNQIALG